MEPPKNETELCSFLGIVNYLSRYTPALAELRPPLDRLYKRQYGGGTLNTNEHLMASKVQ